MEYFTLSASLLEDFKKRFPQTVASTHKLYQRLSSPEEIFSQLSTTSPQAREIILVVGAIEYGLHPHSLKELT